jgi:hypothetical protein
MKKIICEFEEVPKWYGLAYWRYTTRQGVCYPIILNVMVRICLNIWWSLKHGLVSSWYEEKIEEVRAEAWWTGYNFGIKSKTSVMETLLQRILDTQKGGE